MTVLLAILELSYVQVAICINFDAVAELFVVGELTLIDSAILVDVHAITTALFPFHLAKINFILTLDKLKILCLQQLTNCHAVFMIRKQIITSKELTQGTLLHLKYGLNHP